MAVSKIGVAVEQRKEQRLYYDWPVRFTSDFGRPMFQGRMVELSSAGGAFICDADENWRHPGRQITMLFSVPRSGSRRVNLLRVCHIRRVDAMGPSKVRVMVKFAEPLPFKPIEIAGRQYQKMQSLQTAKV